MFKLGWIIASFAAMHLVATLVGFTTFYLVSPAAMWIAVFSLMPLVSAALIYGYLRKMHFTRAATYIESRRLLLVWISLSFVSDALTYILILPSLRHTAPNWTFFRDQSPWIWLSYAVLLISTYTGRWVYLRRLDV